MKIFTEPPELKLRFVMMSSHSLIGLVQSFFTKSDVEADDPMMAM